MTKLLDKAFAEARKLPPEDQDALAARLLDEIADEARWEKSFAETAEQLEKLADEAKKDIEAGKTRPMDFSRRSK